MSELATTLPIKVVITGASGNLGSTLRSHLAVDHRYERVLLDANPNNDPSIIRADLS